MTTINQGNQERIEKVREALTNGKCLKVEFYRDGSGAAFHIIDPDGDHGLSCDVSILLPIDEAMQAVSGFRFKQHELNICY